MRGYSASTGKLKWTWHPLAGSKAPGGANTWSVIAADPAARNGVSADDQPEPGLLWRRAEGRQSIRQFDCGAAGGTGERVWHFQTVHHDLWDYDVAAPPILFDVHREGRTIPAVASGPKNGNFFILDRTTGKPIFGVEERSRPARAM